MSALTTEMLHRQALGLDSRPLPEIAQILAESQVAAAQSLLGGNPAICSGAIAMSATLAAGGRLYYVAAGSSGLMAAADALELGGTFGIAPTQIRILMAGGLPQGSEMPGDTEDASAGLHDDLSDLSERDCVIAVSASGSTPYTMAAAGIARERRATLIGIANNADGPLLGLSDHAIYLATPPEVISGSTRMGAGTAQKIALNMLSTLMAVELGHVHDGMMINLRADNAKLRSRAAGIVARIAAVGPDAARDALAATDGAVKPACLVAAGVGGVADAEKLLKDAGGNLRVALARTVPSI